MSSNMERKRSVLYLTLVILALLGATHGQTTYTYPNRPSTNVPGLQQDSTGRVFVSAGDRLFRLSPDLALEESLTLPAEVVSRGVSLSADGGSVVVCLTDLSCSVYNATNLAAGPLRVANGSIASVDFGVAVFTAGDTFYTGSVQGETRMVLQQNGEGFTRSSDNNPIDDQYIFGTAFSRDFYGGFERDGFAYYFVADYNPIAVRGFRMLRVCNMPDCGGADTCGVTALYEGQFSCGPTPGLESRICGVSLLEGFDGISDPIAVVSRCQPGTTRNFICYVNITAANEVMDGKYDSCKTPPIDPNEEVDLVWERDTFCSQLAQGTSRCDFPLGIGVESIPSTFEVDVGSNIINASVAVVVESFSFVYVGTVNGGTNMIFGYDVGSSSVRLFSGQFFYSGPVDSTVGQMSWQQGQDYITVATTDNVFQLPIEECSSHTDCVSCTAETNPLCGWCVVENKCSRQSQCQNANLTSTVRWTQDNTNCITASVSPNQFVLDMPANLTVTLNFPGLPAPLPNETFSCHLATSEGMFPAIVVPAIEVTPRTVYTCDIQGMVPDYMGVTAVINLSFVSSLIGVPFDTTNGALTIYRCNGTESCSECLQTNSPCGWCNYNKVCSGTDAPCRNTSNFLQLSGNTFQSLCPLLDQPPSGNYVQPVRVNEDIQLITANLPPPDDGFQYRCEVNGVSLTAVYENETSITCTVPANDLVLSGDVGSSSVVAKVIWFGNGIEHPIDNVMEQTNVNLYDCRVLAMGCSSCIGANLGSGFMCGWCGSTCEVDSECTNSLVTNGDNCPIPVITTFIPTTGPVDGGTVITVTGSDLGVTFSDINSSLLLLGGFPCTPINRDYISGSQFLCETTVFTNGDGDKGFVLTIGSRTTTPPSETFRAVVPEITEINPTFGPIAGGTMVTVNGTGLNVGNQEDTVVYFNVNGTTLNCIIEANSILAGSIRCKTSASNQTTSAQVVVGIDNARVTSPSVMFSYRSNPNVTSVSPQNTIPSGGISLVFTGEDLDVVQTPVLEINLPGGDTVVIDCSVENSMTISCITPSISSNVATLDYSLILDGAPPTDSAQLQIGVQSDPSNFRLQGTREINVGTAAIINIQGDNLDSVVPNEITVMVGDQQCIKSSQTTAAGGEIFCTAPADPPNGQSEAEVRVFIGTNINVLLDTRLTYISPTDNVPLEIIIPCVIGGFIIIVLVFLLVMCCIVCGYKSKHKKTEQRWTNLLAQMELLEVEMADECKRAFTELQTDLADLVQISDKNLPYRDFRTFAMRFLFPQDGGDHPVLHALQLPEKCDQEQVMVQLDSFKHLVMDKKFLLIFVRTLESQGQSFTLNDRCIVASLLMVCFQNDLDYATEILQTLLAELMRKAVTKNSHPKLLLRRTESIAEKMLANWLAFLLFPYILEHVGEKLFILFRAIKSQLEKGPVDVITGEAKNSLSEEKLLRHHREVKVVEGLVVAESGEEFSVRLLDCDSITQAKEKILDVLYKNTPVSKRPQLTKVDLELINTGTAGIPLRDQDATNAKDGEWVKVNTLGHYKLDEMSQAHLDNPRNPVPKFRITDRPERPVSGMSFDTLGTIIANISAANRQSLYTPGDLSHIYHLVKPEPEDAVEGGQRGQKIVSEVFLTRLLSTKRILQPYVDDLFDSIFAVPHGRPLPKAIKSLFDFLDLQASELGIHDSEILHTWKTNSVPLRFWVNVIKNPDFLFDINKSATVDSCLTVIAQAYIDACSTTEFKYTKDTPAARLLYVNDVKKYKSGVLQYYGTVQALPKVSQHEMCEYLRETAQVCANSVQQYAPEITNENPGPASMKRQMYFVSESAYLELFKFCSKYADDITDGLNEEGLTIQAAGFDQIRRNMRSAI